ncbi:MAG: 5-formyltetrahydrofolate cyclo-ligase [Verrucomicrobia bacterium]|nr:5-formyltetrahydrofolate cyclo-ligase [Verrucomicrobiota bacterium]
METNRNESISVLKAALRSRIKEIIRAVPLAERASMSRQACAQLEHLTVWRDAGTILFYAPLADEVDIWPLIEAAFAKGKKVALPRFVPVRGAYEANRVADLNLDIHAGKFGVREPAAHCPDVPLNQLDLVLVPGVAFAVDGRRLGRGQGFYDRLLADVRGAKCGMAFEQQVVLEIPAEPHDQMVDYLVTPMRWVAVGPVAAK